jgi:hypothetical protein
VKPSLICHGYKGGLAVSDNTTGVFFASISGNTGAGGVPQKQKLCAYALKTAGQNMSAVDRANAAWDTLQAAADANGIDPALLAANGVRESGFQNVSENDGAGVSHFICYGVASTRRHRHSRRKQLRGKHMFLALLQGESAKRSSYPSKIIGQNRPLARVGEQTRKHAMKRTAALPPSPSCETGESGRHGLPSGLPQGRPEGF